MNQSAARRLGGCVARGVARGVEWLANLTGWRRAIAAFVLGAAAAAAMAPLHLVVAMVAAFTGLVWLLDGAPGRAGAFWTGWWFGYGYFVAGLYWVAAAFFVEPDRFAWMAPLPVLGLPAVLAVFPGLAALFAVWFAPPGAPRVAALTLSWTAAEYLRGQLFGGFPWNLVGYAWAGSGEMLQFTSLVGIHGLGLITIAVAAVPAVLADDKVRLRARVAMLAAVLASVAIIWVGGAVRLAYADPTELADVKLRIVQGNIAQADKWRAEKRPANLARYIEFSSRPGSERISLFVWPETAVPYFLETDEGPRSWIGRLADAGSGDRLVVTGAVRRSARGSAEFRAWNTIQAIDRRGEIVAGSDKMHLVPFGEFLPFRTLLARIGLDKLAHGSVDFTAGDGTGIIDLPGLPPARALICYEAIFPEEIAPPGGVRPGWLLNVTNDAWFGNQAGPHQHFAMARTRAVEQGLPLVRAANTGISAIVDPYGRVRGALGLGTAGVLDGALPRSLAPTLYARIGDNGAFLLWLVSFACLVVVLKSFKINRVN